MNNIDKTINAVAIVGSLRKESYNRKLLRAVQEIKPADIEINEFDIAQIPLFNEDVEVQGDPEPVVHWRQAIASADALLIFTPEYNYGVPGVLKNAVDWASRPYGKSVLKDKPVGLLGASVGMGGTIRAQLSLRQSLAFTQTLVMPPPEVLVAFASSKFDAAGKLVDEQTRRAIETYLEAFIAWVKRFA